VEKMFGKGGKNVPQTVEKMFGKVEKMFPPLSGSESPQQPS
jgi:hypothetical protein